jgi:xanthine dehydrogenase YagS FAD-binding subunit
MKAFEYASPRTEDEAVELLAHAGTTEVLAGGTDLLGLMKKMIVTPDRVVSLSRIESLKAIEADSQMFRIGAMATLDDVLEHPATRSYPALLQALQAHGSLQMRSQGTIGGDLCQRPRCWYFRNGNGLVANRGRHVADGDNRFHAIFDNAGPAKFVCPSRVAPALIALSAAVRVIGPEPGDETQMPLELLFRTPKHEGQREHDLLPQQFVAEIVLPPVDGRQSASYEVHHGAGRQDYPLMCAAASVVMRGGVVADARIVLGQAAPTPWMSREAIEAIVGRPINPQTAEAAGQAAISVATPLAHNEYKVQLAKVAVKRALLLAAGLETGGF